MTTFITSAADERFVVTQIWESEVWNWIHTSEFENISCCAVVNVTIIKRSGAFVGRVFNEVRIEDVSAFAIQKIDIVCLMVNNVVRAKTRSIRIRVKLVDVSWWIQVIYWKSSSPWNSNRRSPWISVTAIDDR